MSQIDKIQKYWDSRAEGFSAKILTEFETDCYAWRERLHHLFSDIPGKKLLDIGCGPGFFTMILSDSGYSVTAFDYSSDMLKKAKENMDKLKLSAAFVKGDAQNLPFENESFDGVISRNLTWNLENPTAAYDEWLRVLKPGGCIINCDGNHYSHYYRREYMIERELPGFSDGHDPAYLKNIDIAVMDEIAKSLPLSKEMRPQWDLNTLIEKGINKTETEIFRKEFTDMNGIKYNIIKNFILKAVK